MYSGLLPPGLTEADLSSDDDDDNEGVTSENRQVQTDEHLSLQSGTEQHPICLQDECNTTKTDLHNYDASGDECLPGVSLDNWQVRGLTEVMYLYAVILKESADHGLITFCIVVRIVQHRLFKHCSINKASCIHFNLQHLF